MNWLLRYKLTNSELFKIDSDYCHYKSETFLVFAVRIILTFIYALSRIWVLFLRNFKIYLSDDLSFPFIGQDTLWQPVQKNPSFSWDFVKSFNWEKQYNEYLPVHLRKNSRLKAEKVAAKMGLPIDGWYACLHVRESGFREDTILGKDFCHDINNYLEAIKEVTKTGGWVVRMGDNTMKPLPKMERVIDYPHSEYKSDTMDVFLIANCRFYIGSQSGILDTAYLFQKPIVLPNMSAWTFTFPPRKCDIGIPKHCYSKSKKRFLSVREILESDDNIQNHTRGIPLDDDFIKIENTPEEIKDLVLEFMSSAKKPLYQYSEKQELSNNLRIKQAVSSIDSKKFIVNLLNRQESVRTQYRIAARVYGVNGAFGKKFLEDNWEANIHNSNLERFKIEK